MNLHAHCLLSAWPWTGCLAHVYLSLITHETEIMMSPPEFLWIMLAVVFVVTAIEEFHSSWPSLLPLSPYLEALNFPPLFSNSCIFFARSQILLQFASLEDVLVLQKIKGGCSSLLLIHQTLGGCLLQRHAFLSN